MLFRIKIKKTLGNINWKIALVDSNLLYSELSFKKDTTANCFGYINLKQINNIENCAETAFKNYEACIFHKSKQNCIVEYFLLCFDEIYYMVKKLHRYLYLKNFFF